MKDTSTKVDEIEEEILSYEFSDAAIENAAGMTKEIAGTATLAFCSGLDTCPA